MTNRGKIEAPGNLPLGIFAGWGTAIIITSAIAACTSSLISGERAGEEVIGTAAVAAIFCSVLAGSIVSKNMVCERKSIACISCGIAYLATLLGIHALFFDGAYQGILPAVLVILGTSVAVCFVEMGHKTQRKAHHKRPKRT